jgi:hypothetical protein
LKVGEKRDFKTGLPTEDVESAPEFLINSPKLNYEFITHTVDSENQVTITINPERKDQAGPYLISIILTDNGSDSKDGPLVETPTMSTIY